MISESGNKKPELICINKVAGHIKKNNLSFRDSVKCSDAPTSSNVKHKVMLSVSFDSACVMHNAADGTCQRVWTKHE